MEYEQPQYTLWSRYSDRSVSSTQAIYEKAFQRIDEVQDWQELTVNLKWADSSTWSLKLPTQEFMKRWGIATPTDSLISDGYGLMGILVFRNGGDWPLNDDYPTHDNGNLLIGGPITNAKRDWNGANDTITLTGESDTYYLKKRLTWPWYAHIYDADVSHWWKDDAVPPNRRWVNAQYGGTAMEVVMREILMRTIGHWAPLDNTGRRLYYFWKGDFSHPGEDDAYKGQGDLVDFASRFDTAYDVCQKLIKLQTSPHLYAKPGSEVHWILGANDIPYFGFDIVQVSDTAVGGGGDGPFQPTGPNDCRLLFRFLTPRDKSEGAVFGTELGNVKNFEYEERAPECNICFILGPNWDYSSIPEKQMSDIDEYMIYQREYSLVSIDKYGWAESFETAQSSDMSGLASIVKAMSSSAKKVLKEKHINIAATMTLDPNQSTEFMNNFQIGDYVTTALGGQMWKDFIREINVSVTPEEGEIVEPTVCDPWKFFWSGGATGRLSKEGAAKLKKMQSR